MTNIIILFLPLIALQVISTGNSAVSFDTLETKISFIEERIQNSYKIGIPIDIRRWRFHKNERFDCIDR